MRLDIQGEEFWLHPDRAVLWPRRRTLIVADTHFGKSALFGQQGVAVPGGSDALDFARLQRLLSESNATRLLILGDFLHGPLLPDSSSAIALAGWIETLAAVQVVVVAGNHDRRIRDLWQPPVEWHTEELVEGPFRFVHEARARSEGFSFSGHVHPVLRIGGHRKRRARVTIFWQRPHGLVLPSFGLFTGGQVVRPAPEDRLYVVAPERVVRWRQACE